MTDQLISDLGENWTNNLVLLSDFFVVCFSTVRKSLPEHVDLDVDF